jgi:hypothetical protein
VGLSVLTVVATPGVDDCVAVTEPLCAVRPDSGNCVACAPWDWDGAAWADEFPTAKQMKMLSRINVAVVFSGFGRVLSFVFLQLCHGQVAIFVAVLNCGFHKMLLLI